MKATRICLRFLLAFGIFAVSASAQPLPSLDKLVVDVGSGTGIVVKRTNDGMLILTVGHVIAETAIGTAFAKAPAPWDTEDLVVVANACPQADPARCNLDVALLLCR